MLKERPRKSLRRVSMNAFRKTSIKCLRKSCKKNSCSYQNSRENIKKSLRNSYNKNLEMLEENPKKKLKGFQKRG